MTRLAAVVLILRPIEDGNASRWGGVELRQWFVHQVADRQPALAEALQAGDGVRPFTVSSLMGLSPRRGEGESVTPEHVYEVRVTALQTELTDMLCDTLAPAWVGQRVELGSTVFQIETVLTTPEATAWGRWVGMTTDADLIQSQALRTDSLTRYLNFEFDSPTVFKRQNGTHVPFPLPELVFGNLLARWNTFSEVHLHPDAQRFADECMAVNRHRLRTATVKLAMAERETAVPGFVGTCGYVIQRGDRYWRGVMHTLAAYAFYAGVGAYTTMGLGRVLTST